MIIRDLNALHPEIRPQALRLNMWACRYLWEIPGDGWYRFAVFETYRSPKRQADLLAQGGVTKAGPWQSAHQYGLALDFAVITCTSGGHAIENTWSWPDDAPWKALKAAAEDQGLKRPIPWDLGHIQSPLFDDIKAAWRD